jgi:hypothetical protein
MYMSQGTVGKWVTLQSKMVQSSLLVPQESKKENLLVTNNEMPKTFQNT